MTFHKTKIGYVVGLVLMVLAIVFLVVGFTYLTFALSVYGYSFINDVAKMVFKDLLTKAIIFMVIGFVLAGLTLAYFGKV